MQIKVKEQCFYFSSSFQSRHSRVFNHGNSSYPKLSVKCAVACSWGVFFISKNTTFGHLFQLGVIWCITWYSQMRIYQQENKWRVKYKFKYSCQNETNKSSVILSIIVLQSVIFEKNNQWQIEIFFDWWNRTSYYDLLSDQHCDLLLLPFAYNLLSFLWR